MANGNEMIRQSLLTVILAIAVGIGSSWVATQAQMAAMASRVEANTKAASEWRETQLRIVTALTKLEEKLGVTERDIAEAKVIFVRALDRMDEIRIRLALLEQRIGITSVEHRKKVP